MVQSTAPSLDSLTNQALEAISRQTGLARSLGLPPPPPQLDEHREKIKNRAYTVLVAGEAKRGKSTFINALIGEDLLPTDVDIATSQMFRIRKSVFSKFNVRYEDGSFQSISEDDLYTYGSEGRRAPSDRPSEHQIIRWIEVDTPATHLPEGIELLDSPGLGSLYAAHAGITYRFLPRADAVIFVLDSQSPIIQSELNFLESILQITDNVFFIQTKIDLFSQEAWEAIRQRNTEILSDRFPEVFSSVRIAPVSSANLRMAADFDDPGSQQALVGVSRFDAMVSDLHAFLSRRVTHRKIHSLVELVRQYHDEVQPMLSRRLSGLAAETQEEQHKFHDAMQQRTRLFEKDWGDTGDRRQILMSKIRDQIELGKRSFRQALQPPGTIARDLGWEIDSMKTIEGLNELGKRLPAEIAQRVADQWIASCQTTERRCFELLEPFIADVSKLSMSMDESFDSHTGASADPKSLFGDDIWERVKLTQRDVFPILGVTTIATVLGMSVLTGPMGWVIGAGIVFAAVRGWDSATQTRVADAKRVLREKMNAELLVHWSNFFDVDVNAGTFNRVDEHFRKLERSISDQLAEIASNKLQDVQNELDRLREEAKLHAEERTKMLESLKKPVEEWTGVRKQLESLSGRLSDGSGAE